MKLILALVVLTGSLSWASITYTDKFSYSQNGSSAGDFTIIPGGDLTTGNTIAPFDSSLGHLISFTVDWNMTYDASATTGKVGGGIDSSVGGNYFLAGVAYDDNGSGGSEGADPDSSASFSFPVNTSDTFLVSQSGIAYNPALLAAVTGSTDFALEFDAPYVLTVDGPTTTWTADANGGVSITYNYAASRELPEPSTLTLVLLAGLVLVFMHRRLRKVYCAQ